MTSVSRLLILIAVGMSRASWEALPSLNVGNGASWTPAKLVDGQLPDELQVRLENNGDADFARIDLASAVPDPKKVSQDVKPYVGSLPPLRVSSIAWRNSRR